MTKLTGYEEDMHYCYDRFVREGKIKDFNGFTSSFFECVKEIYKEAVIDGEDIIVNHHGTYIHVILKQVYYHYCLFKRELIVMDQVLKYIEMFMNNKNDLNLYEVKIEKEKQQVMYYTEYLGAGFVKTYIQRFSYIKRYLDKEELTDELKKSMDNKLNSKKFHLEEDADLQISSLFLDSGDAVTPLFSNSIKDEIDRVYGGKCIFIIPNINTVILSKYNNESKEELDYMLEMHRIESIRNTFSKKIYAYNKGKIEVV